MADVNIGLGQAGRLSQMPYTKRLEVIAEGLPIVLESASGFLKASKALTDHARESDVLVKYAEEEAAKALILIDIVRCPPKLISSKIGTMTRWFYSHLARLIYAKACRWSPMHVSQLQEYVNSERKMHYVDGDYGEYIFPNDELFSRESKLYADIGAHEGDELFWNSPRGFPIPRLRFDPPAYRAVEALAAVGAFSAKGIAVVADVWGQKEFRDTQNSNDGRHLTEAMLEQLIEKQLTLEHATEGHVRILCNEWQLPMYNIDLQIIKVSMDQLKKERGALYPHEY
jgi:hypothetical protein